MFQHQTKIKIIASILFMLILGGTSNATSEVNTKIISTKLSVDKGLSKVQKYADEGDSEKFPRKCTFASSRLVKYVYPDAPKEIYDYYEQAKNVCYGRLHTQALHVKLKNEGASVCEKMEVTLQVNHIKKYTDKTNDMQIWNSFMDDYNKLCPNNSNTGY